MAFIRTVFDSITQHWQRTHASIAPFGTAISTLLLSIYAGERLWQFWDTWRELAHMASLGVIIYGMFIILLEGGTWLVFWALNERAKRLQRRKTQQAVETLDRVEAALAQNPHADPIAVIEQLRIEVRDGENR